MLNFKRFMCVIITTVIFVCFSLSSYINVYAGEFESSDEEVNSLESSIVGSSKAEAAVEESSKAESAVGESLEAESSEVESAEAESAGDESSEIKSFVEESAGDDTVSGTPAISEEEWYEVFTEIDLSEYEDDSDDEGIAPQAEFGAVLTGSMLGDILGTLILGAAASYLGYTGAKELQKNSAAFESLKDSVLSNPTVKAAIESCQNIAFNENGEFSSPAFNAVQDTVAGKVAIKISSYVIDAAKVAFKQWADSNSNSYDGVAVSEKFEAGTVKIDSPCISLITTSLNPAPTYDSLSAVEGYYGTEGIVDYLSSQGYTESSHYFLVSGTGDIVVVPIPFGSSLVQFELHRWYDSLRSDFLYIVSNSVYDKIFRDSCSIDLNSFYYYLLNPSFAYEPVKAYKYIRSSSSWNEVSYGSRLSFSSLCNYKKAFDSGSFVGSSLFRYRGELSRYIASYKAAGKHITYDGAKAPAVPADGLTFTVPESDYAGIDYADFSALFERVSSFSGTLGDISDGQDEIIEQNKGILGVLNNIHSFIKTIAECVGESVSSLDAVKGAIITLPEDIADALSESLVIDIPGLADALTDSLTDVFTDTLNPALSKAIADAVAGIDIAVPDVDVVVNVPDFPDV